LFVQIKTEPAELEADQESLDMSEVRFLLINNASLYLAILSTTSLYILSSLKWKSDFDEHCAFLGYLLSLLKWSTFLLNTGA
jgi:hypothetical protein